MTHSLAVVGALIDSFVDIIAQLIIMYAESGMRMRDPVNYPAGKSRLEPIAIIICSTIMFSAALQLIFKSIESLLESYEDKKSLYIKPFDAVTLYLLGSAIFAKFALYFCHMPSIFNGF